MKLKDRYLSYTELGHGMELYNNRTQADEARIVIHLNQSHTTTAAVVRFLLLHYIAAYLK
jgi:hypothetical protein